jgi:hypothetical protein
VVAACGVVLANEHFGEVVSACAHQIHDEEGQVGSHVDLAQRGVELDGVEHRHVLVLNDHMLGTEVTVIVAHEAPLRALLDPLAVA